MAAGQAAGRGPGGRRKRVVLTLREKMDVCARLEKGESRKALMQEYNVGMSTLYDIRAHKARLLRFLAGSACGPALERRRTLHTPRLERLDRALHAWFLGRRAAGLPVSGPALTAKAKDLYAQLRLTEPCVFSGGWLWRFKARHGIRRLDAAGERQAAERFCGFFRGLAAEHGLTPEQVYNAGETGLFWQCRPGPAAEGEPAPGGRQGRDRLTVLLCANATGSHRIRPLVVGKCGGARAPGGTQQAPGTAGAGRAVLAGWFHHTFAPAVRERFRALGLPADSKAVLLLDGSRAHPPASELVAGSIFTVFLPAGAAALLPPMDQGIRRGFLESFACPPGAPPGCPARRGRSDAVGSVACAWDAVPAAVFSRAWGRLWPGAAAPAEGSSSAEEPERPGARPHDQAFARGPELGGRARARLSGRLEAGAGRPAERPPEQTEDDGPPGAAGRGEAAPWERAAVAFGTVLRSAAARPCFPARELGQLRALRSELARRRPPLRAVAKPQGPRERSGGCAPEACAPCTAGEN